METEEQIVYAIIETVKKGNLSDDNRINERLIRKLLASYRASAIAKSSSMGITISDESFQYLGNVRFDFLKTRQFQATLPKLIMLNNNFGLYFEIDGENIPVLSSEEFNLSLKNVLNGKLPKAKKLGEKFVVYAGEYIIVNNKQKPVKNNIIDYFNSQINTNQNTHVNLDVFGILDDPSNAPGYDWTKDPYPCPSELIPGIKTEIYSKEFNLILSIKSDKVTNSNDEEQMPTRQAQQN
jgi:hypothetical protein